MVRLAIDVNPACKVPAVVYGSPKSDPRNPSPESARIAESLVLLEFVTDLYPDSGLLPMTSSSAPASGSLSTRYRPRSSRPSSRSPTMASHRMLSSRRLPSSRSLLPPAAQFAIGDHFTIADAALAPFLCRWELLLCNDLGTFEEGTGPFVYKELFQSERFARLQTYYATISSRESFKNSFDPARMLFSPEELRLLDKINTVTYHATQKILLSVIGYYNILKTCFEDDSGIPAQ
ncbi:hypothetical protein EDB87DRAFT_1836286 [Lactarius vividus]|nr:hypothetical protein EDB87DRAFT_1836286 [Lactarius vividus]